VAVKRYVGLGKETTYGVSVATTRYIDTIADIKPDQNWLIPTPIGQRMFWKKALGMYRSRGTVGDFPVEPENLGEILLGVLGSVTTTNPASGVYLHEFKGADSIPSYTLRKSVEQTDRVLPGGLFESLTLRINPEDREAAVKAKAELLSGFVETKAIPVSPSFSTLQPFDLGNAGNEMQIAGVNKKDLVFDFEVTMKNNIPFGRGDLSGRTFSKKRLGSREITGKLSAFFDDTTEYDRFIAGTDFSLWAFIKGPVISGAYSYTLSISLPKCVYLRDATPNIVPMNEPLVINAPFKAFYDPSSTYDFLISLQNTISGY